VSLQQFLVITREVVDNVHAVIDGLVAVISGPSLCWGLQCTEVARVANDNA
jgi:hypothetical protein